MWSNSISLNYITNDYSNQIKRYIHRIPKNILDKPGPTSKYYYPIIPLKYDFYYKIRIIINNKTGGDCY